VNGVCGRGVIRPAGFAQEGLLLVERVGGFVHGVDADDQYLVVLTGLERRLRKAGGETVLYLRTQHRTLVIDFSHDYGSVAKPAAERASPTCLVGEDSGHRQTLTEPLLDAGVREIRRGLLRGHADRFVRCVALGMHQGCRNPKGNKSQRTQSDSAHLHRSQLQLVHCFLTISMVNLPGDLGTCERLPETRILAV